MILIILESFTPFAMRIVIFDQKENLNRERSDKRFITRGKPILSESQYFY